MTPSYVFGYGSLVNARTHDYDAVHPAHLSGWRRTWRHVEGRQVAFLTIVRDADCAIDGVIAPVPGGDWEALDIREKSYLREPANGVRHGVSKAKDIRLYHAPAHLHRPHSGHHPILLSYLDVVVQGYFHLGGAPAVHAFFETTDGWDAPILNDRDAPRYPRYQTLTAEETALVDDTLAGMNVTLTG